VQREDPPSSSPPAAPAGPPWPAIRDAVRLRIAAAAAPSTASRFRALVQAQPGVTIGQAAKALGVSHPTSTYHLGRLVAEGQATRVRDGREVRFFPSGQNTQSNYLQALLADPRKRRIIELLCLPGASRLSVNEMSRLLGIRYGFLKRTLEQLERSNLVHLERQKARYQLDRVDPLLAAAAALPPDARGQAATQGK
jgi:DNA-binding transcriptional ArsR family regulator